MLSNFLRYLSFRNLSGWLPPGCNLTAASLSVFLFSETASPTMEFCEYEPIIYSSNLAISPQTDTALAPKRQKGKNSKRLYHLSGLLRFQSTTFEERRTVKKIREFSAELLTELFNIAKESVRHAIWNGTKRKRNGAGKTLFHETVHQVMLPGEYSYVAWCCCTEACPCGRVFHRLRADTAAYLTAANAGGTSFIGILCMQEACLLEP